VIEYRPSPHRFLSGVACSVAGIVIGVGALIWVSFLFGNLPPGPVLVLFVAFVALPVDLVLGYLARPRVLSHAWQSFLLGTSYSLLALPFVFPPISVATQDPAINDSRVPLVLAWLLLPLLAATAVRFGLGRKASGAGV
jgi:hypothetical protein